MNPIKFLIEDFKKDMKAWKEIFSIPADGVPPHVKERFKKNFCEGWGDFFKNNWLFFLLLCLAFASGYFVAGKHYQNLCNTYIWETYVIPQIQARKLNLSTAYDFIKMNMTLILP